MVWNSNAKKMLFLLSSVENFLQILNFIATDIYLLQVHFEWFFSAIGF